jgi:WD40 repeat protein
VWSPDSRRFAYVTRPDGAPTRILIASADGLGVTDSVDVGSVPGGSLTQWTPDGSRLFYLSPDFHPFEASLAGTERTLRAFMDPAGFFAHSRLSPDGRWVAYAQGTLPNVHVFVQGAGGATGRWQVSTSPAARPIWVRGGRGLVFEGFDGRLMEVDVDTRDGFHPGMPRPLFKLPIGSSSAETNSWTCDATGGRFFVFVPSAARAAGIVEVVTDFSALVNRR